MNEQARAILHDLKTPLFILDTNSSSLKHLLLKLIKTYELAKTITMEIPSITQEEIDLISKIIDSFASQANKIESRLNELEKILT